MGLTGLGNMKAKPPGGAVHSRRLSHQLLMLLAFSADIDVPVTCGITVSRAPPLV